MDQNEEKPLVNGVFLLEKYPGKGGWTYAEIPQVGQDPTQPFGWRKVKGFIDHVPVAQFRLMPMGGGKAILLRERQNQKCFGDKRR